MSRRLRFWLWCMDALRAVGFFGSPAYLFCVARASDAADWGSL